MAGVDTRFGRWNVGIFEVFVRVRCYRKAVENAGGVGGGCRYEAVHVVNVSRDRRVRDRVCGSD